MNKSMAGVTCNDQKTLTCLDIWFYKLFLFFPLKTVYTGIDHHWKDAVFATCGQQVDIWDEQRTSPMCSLTWGFDSISSVKFNPIEVIFFVMFWKSVFFLKSVRSELS